MGAAHASFSEIYKGLKYNTITREFINVWARDNNIKQSHKNLVQNFGFFAHLCQQITVKV